MPPPVPFTIPRAAFSEEHLLQGLRGDVPDASPRANMPSVLPSGSGGLIIAKRGSGRHDLVLQFLDKLGILFQVGGSFPAPAQVDLAVPEPGPERTISFVHMARSSTSPS